MLFRGNHTKHESNVYLRKLNLFLLSLSLLFQLHGPLLYLHPQPKSRPNVELLSQSISTLRLQRFISDHSPHTPSLCFIMGKTLHVSPAPQGTPPWGAKIYLMTSIKGAPLAPPQHVCSAVLSRSPDWLGSALATVSTRPLERHHMHTCTHTHIHHRRWEERAEGEGWGVHRGIRKLSTLTSFSKHLKKWLLENKTCHELG